MRDLVKARFKSFHLSWNSRPHSCIDNKRNIILQVSHIYLQKKINLYSSIERMKVRIELQKNVKQCHTMVWSVPEARTISGNPGRVKSRQRSSMLISRKLSPYCNSEFPPLTDSINFFLITNAWNSCSTLPSPGSKDCMS